eukprot:3406521-Lingulodinium_polyedra.AAC.1
MEPGGRALLHRGGVRGRLSAGQRALVAVRMGRGGQAGRRQYQGCLGAAAGYPAGPEAHQACRALGLAAGLGRRLPADAVPHRPPGHSGWGAAGPSLVLRGGQAAR